MKLNQKLVDLIHETMEREGADFSCSIRDIMTDLCHICRDSRINPIERFNDAIEVMDEEALGEAYDEIQRNRR